MVLTCDVHGFLRSTDPPLIMWLGTDGSPINLSTPKYTIESSVVPDGTSVPGLRSTLAINQLEVGDEGTYTCVVDGTSTTTQLTIVAGSTPPVTSTSEFKCAILSCIIILLLCFFFTLVHLSLVQPLTGKCSPTMFTVISELTNNNCLHYRNWNTTMGYWTLCSYGSDCHCRSCSVCCFRYLV